MYGIILASFTILTLHRGDGKAKGDVTRDYSAALAAHD